MGEITKKVTVHSPLEVNDKKTGEKFSREREMELLKNKELAQKKVAETASTSDHHDNAVFSHGPSNRGK